jgi:hypothetical protein
MTFSVLYQFHAGGASCALFKRFGHPVDSGFRHFISGIERAGDAFPAYSMAIPIPTKQGLFFALPERQSGTG